MSLVLRMHTRLLAARNDLTEMSSHGALWHWTCDFHLAIRKLHFLLLLVGPCRSLHIEFCRTRMDLTLGAGSMEGITASSITLF